MSPVGARPNTGTNRSLSGRDSAPPLRLDAPARRLRNLDYARRPCAGGRIFVSRDSRSPLLERIFSVRGRSLRAFGADKKNRFQRLRRPSSAVKNIGDSRYASRRRPSRSERFPHFCLYTFVLPCPVSYLRASGNGSISRARRGNRATCGRRLPMELR